MKASELEFIKNLELYLCNRIAINKYSCDKCGKQQTKLRHIRQDDKYRLVCDEC